MTTEGQAFLIGGGQVLQILDRGHGETPPCPEAKFSKSSIVKIRRLAHLRHLPEKGVIAAVVPPHFSPDDAWADLCKKPRPVMTQVGARGVTYIVAFDGNPQPHLLRERDLLPTDDPPVEVKIGDTPAPSAQEPKP